tara:strand:- start:358 stop:1368 length:1011 start_codon:yes stop_codon:yes gene_type:complete
MKKTRMTISAFLLLLLCCLPVLSAHSKDKSTLRHKNMYQDYEDECIEKGWKKLNISVGGLDRQILWAAPPQGRWVNGAIIALHGGGGSYSNFCTVPRLAFIPIGKPMNRFADMALRQGFAVFSLDSGWNIFTDQKGHACGKRWSSLEQNKRGNVDLDFIKTVIDKVIPRFRPKGSASDIFMTGISNGGFMTILASTYFNKDITAFAPVSAGDPYGVYMDCGDTSTKRANAPGRWYAYGTNKEMGESGSCHAPEYTDALDWPRQTASIPFKQFHHEGDKAVDISCMDKARKGLTKHSHSDKGAHIIKNQGRENIFKHLWYDEYNRPMLEFFKQSRSR